MNFSRPFIERPIGTTLLAMGLMLLGLVAYNFLPVASLPSVEFPTIRVNANLPGADPETMAARVAAPLERRLGEIAGVTELTSTNSLGSTRIAIQFALNRDIEGAAQDVQAAINAAAADLPADMPSLPNFRKSNPAAAPILILALTSKSIAPSDMYDAADTVIAQRISQVDGVAEVTVAGADQPAIRVRVNPMQLASMGLSIEDVRTAITNANAVAPLGIIDGDQHVTALETNGQLRTVEDYQNIVVKSAGGNVVRLSAVANVDQGTRNSRSAAMFNGQPAILLTIVKSADANVIDTVDRIRELIPEIKRWIPAGMDISILTDRTTTLRASVFDMQLTLGLSIVLVMMVVYIFLRRPTPTIAAGITVPLSLAGTCAAMWLAGFSINNLTLMALAVSVGFVVDDAIVMIENMFRNLEKGMSPMRAALEGAQQIGFTVVSISISLIAAFIPLLFMDGVIGRLLREFSVTLVFAIAVSLVVSLTVTPMICAHFVRAAPSKDATWLDRIVEAVLGWSSRAYIFTLSIALRHAVVMLTIAVATVVLTVNYYVKSPKGYFPRDDTGLIFACTRASTDISFDAMNKLQKEALDIVLADPAIDNVGSSVGASGFNAAVNRGRMFISLKPLAERGGLPTNARDRSPAPRARPRERHQRIPERRPGHPGRRAAERFRLSVHAVEPRHRRSLRVGAEGGGQDLRHPGPRRRLHRPRAGRPAGQHHHQPAGGRAPRRAHPGHQQRAQQRVRAASGVGDLHAAQPVSRDPGGGRALPAGSGRSGSHLCPRQQWRAAAPDQRHQDRPYPGAAGGEPSGTIPGRDHQLWPECRHDAG